MNPDVSALVDHLFRQQAGQMVSSLTRVFGPGRIDLAEDVVQEALVEALKKWPFAGVPSNPRAWLVQVARNRAIDRLRREGRATADAIEAWAESASRHAAASAPGSTDAPLPDEVRDDQLRMVFTCCHPVIPREAAVALTLKTVGGFGTPEIARAFLVKEATIAQRIVRAKRALREHAVDFAFPAADELVDRVDWVHEVLYLMFNEGYAAYDGESLVRDDLVREAVRLTALVLGHERTATPDGHALLALMLFQAARLSTRTDAAGDLLLLADQDRAAWDHAAIARALRHLEHARAAQALSAYHLEAGVASLHAVAPSFEETNWEAILAFYDVLRRARPSPIVELNRAVAVAMAHGPEAGLTALDEIADTPTLAAYHLLPATRGELERRAGRPDRALEHFRRARSLARTAPERRLLERRIRELAGG